ncbi:MAG: DUF4340 domain-containing protein [Planctomycetes bacterium]|nr:DUF4340 domain-containing protein [Planctomycetota bacterium]
MKTKTTIILLVVAILFGAYLYFFERHQPTKEEVEQAQKKFFQVDAKDITKVEIIQRSVSGVPTEASGYSAVSPSATTTITCTREGDDWQMTTPVKAKSDKSALDGIVQDIVSLEKKNTISAPKDLAQYGLDNPRVIVSFTGKPAGSPALMQGKDNKVYNLKFGKDAPMDLGIYLKVTDNSAERSGVPSNDGNVYIVAKSLFDKTNKSVFDLRYKKIFDTDVYQLAKLRLNYPSGQAIEMEKKGEDWFLLKPVADKCDIHKVNDLRYALNDTKSTEFVDENAMDFNKYGLTPPEVMLEGTDSTGKTETLLVGKVEGKFYAMKQGLPVVSTIDPGVVTRLMPKLEDLRYKKFFELDKDKLTRIEIKHHDRQLAALNKDTDWKMAQPATAEFNPDSIKDFVEKLNDTEIEQFVADTDTNLAPYGLVEPFSGLEITLNDSRYLFGIGQEQKYVYVKMAGQPKVVAFNKNTYDYVRKGSIHFRKKNILNIAPDKVTRLTIIQKDKEPLVYEQAKLQEWKMVAPREEPVAVRENINGLRNEFCFLSAGEYLADQSDDLTQYGLTDPATKITLEHKKDDNTAVRKTLVLGIKKADTNYYYGMLEDEPVVFTVPDRLVETLQKIITPVEPPK